MTGSVPAPWGLIRIATNARGVVAIEQLVSEEAFAAGLARRFGVGAAAGGGHRSEVLARAVVALRAFVDGDLAALTVIPIDLADRSRWDRLVFDAVRMLRPGTTASYGDIARMIGKPGAARAVGGAVARCPIGLAIPCHRVIAGDGTLGGYGGGWWGDPETGLQLKRELLEREGVFLDR